jgi:two-component system chemotaxis response regulator CheB
MSEDNFYYVAIGSSAGGIEALCQFFNHLAPTAHAAYFVVPHLSRDFRSSLDDILRRHTGMNVVRVTETVQIRAATVYVLTEDTMMFIRDGQLVCRKRTYLEKINRAVNIFFESLSTAYKEKVVGVVLSGFGEDGAEGVKMICDNGGRVLVQDPETTQYPEMPIASILADDPLVGSPAGLAMALVEMIQQRPSVIE